MRVLPPVGTYKAHVEIQVHALDVPAQIDEFATWTKPRLDFVQSEDIGLTRDAHGNVQGWRNLSDEEGIQFVFLDSQFCVGFRYEPTVCRTPDEGEVNLRVSELERTYSDVVARVSSQLEWTKEQNAWIATLKNNSKHVENLFTIRSLTGHATTLQNTGEIRVQLNYELEGRRPDHVRYQLRVRYEHTVSPKAVSISLPENALFHEERHRPLLARKTLLGDSIPAPLRHLYGRSHLD